MSVRFSALLGALLLAACGRSDVLPTAPDGDGLVQLNATSQLTGYAPSRPFKGSCELTIVPISNNFPILTQRDTGPCQLTHFGRANLDGVLTINVLAGTQAGTRTFKAANGDELYATVAGTSSMVGPGLVSFSATFTFTGGTGRFANASGSAQGTGVANQIERTSTVSLSGTIAY